MSTMVISPSAQKLPSLPACFPLKPDVRWNGPRHGLFAAPFAYESKTLGRLVIPAGFDTDYASIPRGLWNLYPPDGPWSPIAWIHDLLYWYQGYPILGADGMPVLDAATGEPISLVPVTRAEADDILREGMLELGIRGSACWTFHKAVRLFGGGPWDRAFAERTGVVTPVQPVKSAPKMHHRK